MKYIKKYYMIFLTKPVRHRTAGEEMAGEKNEAVEKRYFCKAVLE